MIRNDRQLVAAIDHMKHELEAGKYDRNKEPLCRAFDIVLDAFIKTHLDDPGPPVVAALEGKAPNFIAIHCPRCHQHRKMAKVDVPPEVVLYECLWCHEHLPLVGDLSQFEEDA